MQYINTVCRSYSQPHVSYSMSCLNHLSHDDCLEDNREDYQNRSVLYSVTQLCTIICTLVWAVLTDELF